MAMRFRAALMFHDASSVLLGLAFRWKALQCLIDRFSDILMAILPVPDFVAAVSSPYQLVRFRVDKVQNEHAFEVVRDHGLGPGRIVEAVPSVPASPAIGAAGIHNVNVLLLFASQQERNKEVRRLLSRLEP